MEGGFALLVRVNKNMILVNVCDTVHTSGLQCNIGVIAVVMNE
jgi:hypothetical protein